jgi:hypothetical protein
LSDWPNTFTHFRPLSTPAPLSARLTKLAVTARAIPISELAGQLWENYDGTEFKVTRSVWEGHVNEPKTRRSKAPVPIIPVLARILDAYRLQCGNPKSGPMFKSEVRTPMNMNNVLSRLILPALNVCEVCRKECADHAGVDHDFKRDASRPEWHGWHAFRRGLGTNLAELGLDDS